MDSKYPNHHQYHYLPLSTTTYHYQTPSPSSKPPTLTSPVSTTDLLCDRNNLRVLLEFAQSKTVGPFRLDAYLVGPTLILVRRDDSFWKVSDGKSYGFNFESAFTAPAPDMADATSHYRAIRYRMGPLNVVCRFEADAYFDGGDAHDDVLQPAEAAAVVGDTLRQTAAAAAGGDADGAAALPLPTAGLATRPRFAYRAPWRVLQKGHVVPCGQVLELKTQAEKGDKNALVACQDQLWFGRTPHLFTGRYESGYTPASASASTPTPADKQKQKKNFTEPGTILYIKQESARQRTLRWEQREQASLQRLVTLLLHIRAQLAAQRGPVRAAVLARDDARGPLGVYEMLDKYPAVPYHFFQRFWGQGVGGGVGTGPAQGLSAFGAQRAGFNAARFVASRDGGRGRGGGGMPRRGCWGGARGGGGGGGAGGACRG